MMQTWYWKKLGDGEMATQPVERLKEAFQELFESAGKPIDMAVFTRRDLTGLHCELHAYFPPAASEIACAFGAQPCERPPRRGLDLLAGDQRCWALLFQDKQDR